MHRSGTRKRGIVVGLSLLFLVGAFTTVAAAQSGNSCAFPTTSVDATGTSVTVDERPERIVTLGASAAQTVWEIESQDRVVGITQYATYLDGANAKPIVGGFTVSVENVVDQNPDLVLAANTIPDDTVATLRNSGVTVYKFREATSVDFVAEKTELFGELIGSCDVAQDRATTFREEIDRIERAVQGEPRPRVLHLLGSDGYAPGRETFIGTMIETAGGTNVAADDFAGYRQISSEVVLQDDPQWITRTRSFDLSPYAGTTAVETNQVLELDSNYLSQPAPRITIPMVKMVQEWHPQAYENADLASAVQADNRPDGPVYDSTLRSDGTAYLTISHFWHRSPYVATFQLPSGFGNASERVPDLQSLEVSPSETEVAFQVTVSPLDGNVTLPGGDRPLAGYRVTATGIEYGAVANLTARLSLNATARNLSASDLRAYTRVDGNWTRANLTATGGNETLHLAATVPSFGPLYLAQATGEPSERPLQNATGTAAANGTATAETNVTVPTNQTATAPGQDGATATPASSPTADQSSTDERVTATDQAGLNRSDTPTSASGPGFGLAAVVLSMLAFGVVVGRLCGE